MAGESLADTCAIIESFRGNAKVMALFEREKDVGIPAIVLGELYYGALCSDHQAHEWRKVTLFSAGEPIFECDEHTAVNFAKIKHELRLKGRMIPEADIWISALARQHDRSLITNDAHFAHIDGLRLVSW